jgi:glycosidase
MNRFLWVAHNNTQKLKLAALCQFTLTGAPVIYYGTEVGLSQSADVMQHGRAIHEETRMPMLWGDQQDKDLFEFYRQLIQMRKNETVLVNGQRKTVLETEEVLAYRRANDTEGILVIMNISERTAGVELEVTESNPLLTTNSDCRIQAEGSLKRFILPPFSGMIVK